jgi:rhodanese-related sulfurtransferase
MVEKLTDIEPPDLAIIDTATLATLVRADVPMVLIDARGEPEGMKFIPGARLLELKSTASEIEEAIPSRDCLVVTYCTNIHCPLSMEMYGHLKDLGYENVLEYQDGVEGWQAAGYPVAEVAAER